MVPTLCCFSVQCSQIHYGPLNRIVFWDVLLVDLYELMLRRVLLVSVRAYPTSCSVRLSLKSRVLTAVQSCCISLSGRVSSPGGKGSSSLPKPSPELQSAGSRLVGRLGSLEERESNKEISC